MSSSADFVAVIDGDLQHGRIYRPSDVPSPRQGLWQFGDRNPAKKSKQRKSLPGAAEAERYRRVGLQANREDGRYRSNERLLCDSARDRLSPRLSPDGFKILVDVILSADSLSIVEAPYAFRRRNAGESKLTLLVGVDFLGLVVHHLTAGVLPIRCVLFAIVGAIGLGVHIIALSAVLHWFRMLTFDSGQLIATILAMASNFILNNEITYRPISVP